MPNSIIYILLISNAVSGLLVGHGGAKTKTEDLVWYHFFSLYLFCFYFVFVFINLCILALTDCSQGESVAGRWLLGRADGWEGRGNYQASQHKHEMICMYKNDAHMRGMWSD